MVNRDPAEIPRKETTWEGLQAPLTDMPIQRRSTRRSAGRLVQLEAPVARQRGLEVCDRCNNEARLRVRSERAGAAAAMSLALCCCLLIALDILE
jgi:hypothetical protein